jgi:hypothetical protein
MSSRRCAQASEAFGNPEHRGGRALLGAPVALALSAIFLVGLSYLAAPTALAATAHEFEFEFDGAETPAKSLGRPGAVAVSRSTGDVYVADAENSVVNEFAVSGGAAKYAGQLTGTAGSGSGTVTEGSTVIESVVTTTGAFSAGQEISGEGIPAGTTITNAPGGGVLEISQPAEASGLSVSLTAQQSFSFSEVTAVAVDNAAASGEPAAGDVYVVDGGHGVVDKFGPEGEFEGQLGGVFEGPLVGVAVDVAGDVWVAETRPGESQAIVYEFAPDGSPVGPSPRFHTSIAAEPGFSVESSAAVYLADPQGVRKYNSAGEEFNDAGEVQSGAKFEACAFCGSTGIAVDLSTGDVYFDNAQSPEREPSIAERSSGGGALAQFAQQQLKDGGPGGIAVDPAGGQIYVSSAVDGKVYVFAPTPGPRAESRAATEITATTARLNASVNPEGAEVEECFFEYGESTAYGSTAPCEPGAGAIGKGTEPVDVTAGIGELEGGTLYHYRVVAKNPDGTTASADATFETLPVPAIESATVTRLSATSVQLNVTVNPRGLPVTFCAFELGTSSAYGTTVPCEQSEAQIGAGDGPVQISATVAGLAPNTTYHWRVVLRNENGTAVDADHSFVYTTTGEGLPDGRQYEMVTPSRKNGALIGATANVPDISADGSRVIAGSIQCFAAAESCNAISSDEIGTPFEFTRTGAGWTAAQLAPSAAQFSKTTTPWFSSAESGSALFSAPTEPFGEDDLYAREPGGGVVHIGPLTPPEDGPLGPIGAQAEARETADLSHVVWEAPREQPHWPFDESLGGSVYEYAAVGSAHPFLVGVGGENDPGSTDLISTCETALGSVAGNPIPPGSVSADGRVVYFTAIGGEGCVGSGANATTPVEANTLYARVDGELPDARTVPISARAAGDCSGACLSSPPGDAQLIDASADGAKALFASTQQLTDQASEDSQAGDSAATPSGCSKTTDANGCNLYEMENVTDASPAARRLIAVSAGSLNGGGPRVQGVLAFSADGSHVYFVAHGVLSNSPNPRGQRARDGANNLYAYERDAGHPAGRMAFVTDLARSDIKEWSTAAEDPANVTPDGRFLVFLSHGRLTADDTSSSGADQVYRYDAATEQLVRLSVGDEGFNDNGNRSAPTPCDPVLVGAPDDCSENASIAYAGKRSPRRDLTMSDDGSYVFFQSPVALTPHALDAVQISTYGSGLPMYAQNVYEWHDGHVYLVSDGRDASVDAGQIARCAFVSLSSTCLLGADTSGTNVFFATTDPLVPADANTELDYYDARVCTAGNPCIQPAPAPPPPCAGETCHGNPASQAPPPSGGTFAFNGEGNAVAPVKPAVRPLTRAQKLARALKACHRKHNRRKRKACERQARKRYGPHKARKRKGHR